ncbi:MAG: hypothetical protein HZB46_13185 [Solirubrobacterales bacterium]|nr:hypothetical protein [Solirubrobacterales bacterium]
MTGTDDDPASEVRNEAAGVFHGAFVQARSIGALHVHGHGPVWPVPRQLPPAPRQFVNRAREILQLDAMSTGGAGEPGPAVLVVTGMHGVGKTATTRHWASRNRERFGDGQLYADFGALRHRGGVAVGEVLGGFLRAFGLSDEVIPVSLQERAALYRSQTADKRVLLLLDDVEHAAQVAPLIPNADDSVVLVTTRSSLEELVRDGAGVVRLDPLDPLSASAMLAAMIGEERVAAESGPVARLVEFCDGLPIALRICGARSPGCWTSSPTRSIGLRGSA